MYKGRVQGDKVQYRQQIKRSANSQPRFETGLPNFIVKLVKWNLVICVQFVAEYFLSVLRAIFATDVHTAFIGYFCLGPSCSVHSTQNDLCGPVTAQNGQLPLLKLCLKVQHVWQSRIL
jgi:hypothetical protein